MSNGVTYKVRVAAAHPNLNVGVQRSGIGAWVELTVTPRVNSRATGPPAISGITHTGQTLTVDTSGIVDADGLTNVSYTYQWIRSDGNIDTDIAGETASTYTLVSDDEGKTIKVRVSFTDDAENAESLTSGTTSAIAAKPNAPAAGAPTISGTPQVDQTLTAGTSDIADEDGLTNVAYSYQWIRSDGGTDTDIVGETNSTYTLVSADQGKTIKVKVSFTDDAGNEETLTSAATGVVAAKPNTPATGTPTISQTAQVGQTLTADVSSIADEDGLTSVSYSYQWLAANVEIAGATNSTYTLSDEDEGKAIKVKVSFTDDGSNDETLTSAATAVVAAKPNSPATGAPVITGTAQVDETLTADTSGIADLDGLTSVSYSYQWVSNDGNTDTDIAGQTDSTYTLVVADVGKTIKVRVSFTDDAENAESLTSGTTSAVAAKPNTPAAGAPTIGGTPQVDETLTAGTSDIADEDGLTNVSYSYLWVVNDGATDAEIEGATASTYTPSASELGKTIKVRVSFTDDADNEEALTSGATATVTRPPPRAPELDGISIHDGMLRVSGGSLQLSDSAPPSSVPAADVGSYISSFKVQWKSGSQEYDATRQSVVAPEPVTANVAFYSLMPSYDITGLTNDVEYTVRVIATNAGGDGPPAQEQTATPNPKSEGLWQYIEDDIVEEHEASHPWLRQTWNYLQNNNIPLIIWTDASDPNTVETYFDDSSGIEAEYVRSLNFPVSVVDAATKKETILGELAYIYTMTNGVSSSPAPLGIAHVYFRTVDTLSLSGCWDSRLYLDVVVSLVLHDSLAVASDWNRCMARSEDATGLAVVRSALSGQTPAWFADTYHDSEGNPDLERLWTGVQIVAGGHNDVVAYQLRNSFGGYCDTDPSWGLRISRSAQQVIGICWFRHAGESVARRRVCARCTHFPDRQP